MLPAAPATLSGAGRHARVMGLVDVVRETAEQEAGGKRRLKGAA